MLLKFYDSHFYGTVWIGHENYTEKHKILNNKRSWTVDSENLECIIIKWNFYGEKLKNCLEIIWNLSKDAIKMRRAE